MLNLVAKIWDIFETCKYIAKKMAVLQKIKPETIVAVVIIY